MKHNRLKKERIEEAADRPSNNIADYTTDESNHTVIWNANKMPHYLMYFDYQTKSS